MKQHACHPNFILESLNIDTPFLQGFTYKELAEATGEKDRMVCFKLPPGSAAVLRRFEGFEDFDESIHCLKCVKPGTGKKDAPRAFSLKLSKIPKAIGLKSTSYDPEFECMHHWKGKTAKALGDQEPAALCLMTAKHVDDVNKTGNEEQIDYYAGQVEKIFGQ